jgi:hypothetical protein
VANGYPENLIQQLSVRFQDSDNATVTLQLAQCDVAQWEGMVGQGILRASNTNPEPVLVRSHHGGHWTTYSNLGETFYRGPKVMKLHRHDGTTDVDTGVTATINPSMRYPMFFISDTESGTPVVRHGPIDVSDPATYPANLVFAKNIHTLPYFLRDHTHVDLPVLLTAAADGGFASASLPDKTTVTTEVGFRADMGGGVSALVLSWDQRFPLFFPEKVRHYETEFLRPEGGFEHYGNHRGELHPSAQLITHGSGSTDYPGLPIHAKMTLPAAATDPESQSVFVTENPRLEYQLLPIASEEWRKLTIKLGPDIGAISNGVEVRIYSGDSYARGDRDDPQAGFSLQVLKPGTGLEALAVPSNGIISLPTGNPLYTLLTSEDGLQLFLKRTSAVNELHHLSVDLLPKTGDCSPFQVLALDLLPVDFITGGGDSQNITHQLKESSGPPVVRLNAITTNDVSVSNGVATVSISGKVYDAIMGAVPSGKGADIEGVRVFLNGAETDFEEALHRNSDHVSFWAPYGPSAGIPSFEVTIPASGVNRIRVETTPNVAGKKGYAEFDVVFEKDFAPPVVHPAQAVAVDILIAGAFSDTTKDTIDLALPGQPANDSLEETEVDSGIFVSATTGAVVTLPADFTPTSSEDDFVCRLAIPGIAPAGSGGTESSGEILCEETGPTTLRFAYRHTIPAQTESSDFTWELSSVDMLNEGYLGMAHPIAFRTASLGTAFGFKGQGAEFPILEHAETEAFYASTTEGKPLIGFLVRQDGEEGDGSLEFLYYDHEDESLKRQSLADFGLSSSALNLEGIRMPVTNFQRTEWRLLDTDGSPSEGLIPVNIEALIDLVEGDSSIEIPEDSQAIIEVSGHPPDSVLCMFSPENPGDRFDMVMPGGEPASEPAERNVTFAAVGGSYRTIQKLVIYDTGGNSPSALTDSQWNALKALGYLAVHNADPVIASAKDLEWAMEKFGPPHPPEGITMGVPGVTDPKNAQFYRFDGYQDHHLFNQYEKNPGKRARWNKIFGADFDVDEFTVPVKTKYHSKISKNITREWDDFLAEYFDSSHQLKSGVDIQQLRRTTLDKMRSINAQWGIDTSQMRPYPQILGNSLTTRPTLCNRLIENPGRLGTSLDRFKMIDEAAFGPLFKGSNVARNAWWKDTAKKAFKRGGKNGVKKVIPILSAAITIAKASAITLQVGQEGWEEAMAQAINEELGLEDIELARSALLKDFSTSLIGGGTSIPALTLPNGQVIGIGERNFHCYFNFSDRVYKVVPYMIHEIKVFPDGTLPKVALRMEDRPFEIWIASNPPFLIRDYWPAIGDSRQLYDDAKIRAKANSNGGP